MEFETRKQITSYGTFSINLRAKKVTDSLGNVIALTPQEYKLLEFGLSNLGKAISKENILDSVWGENAVVVHTTLRNRIGKLRNKLDLSNENSRLEIITITGLGYRFDLRCLT